MLDCFRVRSFCFMCDLKTSSRIIGWGFTVFAGLGLCYAIAAYARGDYPHPLNEIMIVLLALGVFTGIVTLYGAYSVEGSLVVDAHNGRWWTLGGGRSATQLSCLLIRQTLVDETLLISVVDETLLISVVDETALGRNSTQPDNVYALSAAAFLYLIIFLIFIALTVPFLDIYLARELELYISNFTLLKVLGLAFASAYFMVIVNSRRLEIIDELYTETQNRRNEEVIVISRPDQRPPKAYARETARYKSRRRSCRNRSRRTFYPANRSCGTISGNRTWAMTRPTNRKSVLSTFSDPRTSGYSFRQLAGVRKNYY